MGKRPALIFTVLLLADAGSAPASASGSHPPRTVEIEGELYGPPARFKGVHAIAFELSAFKGCWFTNGAEFYRQFKRLALPDPPRTTDVVEYELEFIGRRTVRKRDDGAIGGFGHLGMFSCQIRAEKLISAKLLTTAAPSSAD